MVDALMNFVNYLIQTVGKGLTSLLPLSPFRSFIDNWNPPVNYLGWLNWFVPVSDILTILGIWLTAIGLFYLYSILMRWVKMIGD